MNKNYYELLGLSQHASKDEIKKAYFKLAKKYHPDLNKEKDSEKKFKDITEAYQTLFDENSRREYDDYLKFSSSSSNSTSSSLNSRTHYEKKYFDSGWIEKYLNLSTIDIHRFEQEMNTLSTLNKYYTYEYFFLAFWAGSNITVNLLKNKMCVKIFEVFERSIDKSFIFSMSRNFATSDLNAYDEIIYALCKAINKKGTNALSLIIDLIDDENIFDNSNTAMISLVKFNSTKTLIRLIDQNVNMQVQSRQNTSTTNNNFINKIKSNKIVRFLIYVLGIIGIVVILSFIFNIYM